ncbi:BON domain-containing protein [Massilia sp. DWR3-1-1]|uniref:BON domain-containing protein n=1 Tax=Massilia sp. DWR3-1-1 TaxID=2804559 RepID=UPI003CF22527
MKTDITLQQDVLAELAWDPAIDATAIGVQVHEGIVTLSGEVASFAEKWDAENAARQVSGVRALTVALEVRLAGSSRRDDVDIARTVENTLLWSTAVPDHAVQVTVEGGYVTLSGKLAWAYQRHAAVQAVRYLMGVTGVSDQIVVQPHVSALVVQDQIEASLKRRAHQDASRIAVSVNGDTVTLTGLVANWTEHNLACHAAWSSPGVHEVIDHLRLA